MYKYKLITILVAFTIILSFLYPVWSQAEPEIQDLPEKHEGVYIEVNKTSNTLKVFLNGNVIKTFRVATGKTAALTPEGTFKIITKVKNPWYLPKNIPGGAANNPLGKRWLGLSVPNTGGYKYGIHGTNNPASIGHRVSSGCIRMYNRDVEWLFRHIPLQTPVIITN